MHSSKWVLSSKFHISCYSVKYIPIIQSFSPKVLLVEEAGQVLEAHVLGSLVSSVEHLILIGDPLQLRPNLANYSKVTPT
jgi:superfamily I DNA and/or RNA helicase